jgi:hypothetical protein
MITHKLIKAPLHEQLDDIKLHPELPSTDETIFHCYWNKNISEKQIFSILSCYSTNILNTNNKIILWTEEEKNVNYEFLKNFCEIRYFDHLEERKETPLENYKLTRATEIPSLRCDYLRYIFLSKYGGVYFDLDVFFFKSFNYLIKEYGDFVYGWEYQNYPNNAIYCINNKNVVNDMIEVVLKYGGSHLSFQDVFGDRQHQDKIGYNNDVNLNVLPCGWFDPMWIETNNNDFNRWFENNNNEYYYDDVYCYHWHNRNHLGIQTNSPFYKNVVSLFEKLKLKL